MPIILYIKKNRKGKIIAKRKQNKIRSFVRFVGSLIAASFLVVMLSGCSDEKVNPLGTEKLNGEAPKEEAFAVQMDCSGLYNGVYLPEKKNQSFQTLMLSIFENPSLPISS